MFGASILCDARHCVSGTLNFITFGKIPLFSVCILLYHEREEGSGSLSQSDVIRKEPKAEEGKNATESDGNFIFNGANVSSVAAAVVFSTLEKFISK